MNYRIAFPEMIFYLYPRLSLYLEPESSSAAADMKRLDDCSSKNTRFLTILNQ